MNLQQYRELRQKISEQEPKHRDVCMSCRQPRFACYCQVLKPFHCPIEFVILIHGIEARRRIATGRMAHLALTNSNLIAGCDYSQNAKVNEIINDPDRHCVILYPGQNSIDIGVDTEQKARNLALPNKCLTVFVIDGTWATARKMVRLSENLHGLQRICFTPTTPSNFRVRKQPKAECYSTIEAIHHTIELLGPSQNFATDSRQHDQLLNVFDWMVEGQLKFIEDSRRTRGPSRYRREREKRSQKAV